MLSRTWLNLQISIYSFLPQNNLTILETPIQYNTSLRSKVKDVKSSWIPFFRQYNSTDSDFTSSFDSFLCLNDHPIIRIKSLAKFLLFSVFEKPVLFWFPKTGDWERCGVRYFLVLRSTNVTRHEESALAQISGMFTAQMTFRNLGR